MLSIEIVAAQSQRSVVKHLSLPHGAVIADALRLAAADVDFFGIDLAGSVVGVFGKVAPRDQALQHGDRIEIYRPLAEEPKLARRRRARRDAHGGVRPGLGLNPSKSGRS
jgi:uncharacterized protein